MTHRILVFSTLLVSVLGQRCVHWLYSNFLCLHHLFSVSHPSPPLQEEQDHPDQLLLADKYYLLELLLLFPNVKLLFLNNKLLFLNVKLLFLRDKLLFLSVKLLFLRDKQLFPLDKLLFLNNNNSSLCSTLNNSLMPRDLFHNNLNNLNSLFHNNNL